MSDHETTMAELEGHLVSNGMTVFQYFHVLEARARRLIFTLNNPENKLNSIRFALELQNLIEKYEPPKSQSDIMEEEYLLSLSDEIKQRLFSKGDNSVNFSMRLEDLLREFPDGS